MMDYKANSDAPVAPEKSTEMGPTEGGKSSAELNLVAKHPMMGPEHYAGSYTESCPDGDNPNIGGISAELPSQGDLRNRDTQRGSNPFPGMPGASSARNGQV